MNSKEVVNAVLNHRQPEYIPLGTYAIDCDTVEKVIGHETYVRNKIKTWIALYEGRRDEVAQSWKEDSVELFRKLDCIDVVIPFKEAPILPELDYVPEIMKKIDENTWETESGYIYQYSDLTNDIAVVKFPETIWNEESLRSETEFDPPDESIFEAYDYLIRHIGGSRFMAGISGGLGVMPLPGGMENGLMEYYLNPELMQLLIKQSIRQENFLDRFYIRNGVDQVFVEVDPATTANTLLPPEKFREFCLPAMKQRVDNIKKYRDKVMLHSCGNTWKLMDMFIEAGIDCNQSLQTGAGMDIKRLKEEFGSKMCFWGGVSVEKLIMGSMDEVREDVRYAMRHGSPNGGFILGPSHSIAYGVKYDNFMAMLDEHSKLKYFRGQE